MGVELVDRDVVLGLEGGLTRAAAKVREARVRAAAGRGLGRAAWAAGATAAGVAGVVAVGRLTGAAPWPAPAWVGAAGLSVAAAVAAAPVGLAWRRRPDPSDVAERLDLATADHNAVATALDLARSGERSPFAGRAIAAGAEVLRVAGSARPVGGRPTGGDRRGWAAVAVGGAAVALALLVPVRPAVRVAAVGPHDGPAGAVSPRSLPGDPPRPSSPPPPRAAADDARPPGSAAPSPTPASPGPSKEARATASQSSASTAGSSGNSAQVATAANAAAPPKRPGDGHSPAAGGQPPDPARAADDAAARPMELASLGSAAADASRSHDAPHGGSGGAGDADANPSRSDQHAGASSGSQGTPKETTGSKQSEAGSGDEAGSGSSKAPSNLGGRSMSTGLAASGNGQSGGENAPKKSRGVAPLLLGTPEPDLFEGRPLPGPDERTRLQVTPRPVPGEPAAAAAAAPRRDDEPAVPAFRVPAESRRMVDDYFERFHQEAGPQSTDPTH